MSNIAAPVPRPIPENAIKISHNVFIGLIRGIRVIKRDIFLFIKHIRNINDRLACRKYFDNSLKWVIQNDSL